MAINWNRVKSVNSQQPNTSNYNTSINWNRVKSVNSPAIQTQDDESNLRNYYKNLGFTDNDLAQYTYNGRKSLADLDKSTMEKNALNKQKIASKPIESKSGFSEKLHRASNTANKWAFGIDFAGDREKAGIGTNMDKEIVYGEKSTGDKIAEGAGTLAGFAIPYSKAYGATDKLLKGTKYGTQALNKVNKLPKGAKYADDALRGSLSGLQVGAYTEGRQELMYPEEQDWKGHLKDIGIETLAGGIGDPLLRGAGQLGKQGLSKVSPKLDGLLGKFNKGKITKEELTKEINNSPELRKEVLLLTEPQKQLQAPIKTYKPKYEGPTNQTTNERLLLPEGEKINITNSPKTEPYQFTKQQLIKGELPNFKLDTGLNKYDLERKIVSGAKTVYNRKTKRYEMVDDSKVEFIRKGTGSSHNIDVLHKKSIENAINQGKIVPEEVLKEYPDLAKKVEKNPVTTESSLQFKRERYVPMVESNLNYVGKLDPLNKMKIEKPKVELPKPIIKNTNLSKVDNIQSNKEVATGKESIKESTKDLGRYERWVTDFQRNIEKVFGKDSKEKVRLVDSLDNAKKGYVNDVEDLTTRLYDDVVKKLGISKGSEKSKLVQRYGEKNISLDELKKQRPNDWQDIVKADDWFRKEYDTLLDDVNNVIEQIYPNQPDKLVPKRQDYYRHFKELEGLEGLKNSFESTSNINPALEGVSAFTKPNTKWQSFKQKRGLGEYKEDAVGGFLDYLKAASYSKNIDPEIKNIRTFRQELLDSGRTDLNSTIGYLDYFANDLAGKTNFIDRPLVDLFGRSKVNTVNSANSRVKKNAILGNVSSLLSQSLNIPNGLGYAKQYSVNGAKRYSKTLVDRMKGNSKNNPIDQSTFLKERTLDKNFRKFDEKLLQQPKNFASWLIEKSDQLSTEYIWSSMYEKGLAEKVKDPIRYADEWTRKAVAGRGIGEVPIAQKSKLVQVFLPFTVEVNNALKVQKDLFKGKDVGGLITLYLGSHLMSEGLTEVRGFGGNFDPIGALEDALTEEELTTLERLGRVGGEVLSAFPSGQYLASLYPEYGNIGNLDAPTRKELFGTNDPTRFGTGPVLKKAIEDPLTSFVTPFGGKQIKKTTEGIESYRKEGVYNKDGDKLQYPVEQNKENLLKSLLFGKYSTDEAKEYYSNDRRPLGTNQTKEYQNSGNPQAYYNDLMKNREIDKLIKQMDDIRKSKELSDNEKREQIQKLDKKIREISKGGS